MPVEFAASLDIQAAFVRMQNALARDIADENVAYLIGAELVGIEHANLAATLDQSDDGALARQARFAVLRARANAILRAEIGFVGFNDLAFAADRTGVVVFHRLTDAMRH